MLLESAKNTLYQQEMLLESAKKTLYQQDMLSQSISPKGLKVLRLNNTKTMLKSHYSMVDISLTISIKINRISKGTVWNFKMKAQHANRIVNITHYGHQI